MKLYGMFVGINTYQDTDITRLHFACADAVRFDALLQNALGSTEYRSILLLDAEATRSNILDAIGNDIASQATAEDIVLLHFSGHGSPEIGQKERIHQTHQYLIPYDAKYDNIYGTAIDMEEGLRSLLSRLRAKTILTVVDTCFSGRAGGRTFEGPYRQQARAGMRGSAPTLRKLDYGKGCAVLTACSEREVAHEDASLGHGILSYALFESLTDPTNQQRTIGLGTLADQVASRVWELSKRKQHPHWTADSSLGKFPRLLQK